MQLVLAREILLEHYQNRYTTKKLLGCIAAIVLDAAYCYRHSMARVCVC